MAESVIPSPGIFANFSKAVRKLYNRPYTYNLPYTVPSYDVKQVTPTVDAIDSLEMLCQLGTEDVVTDDIDFDQQLSIGFDTSTSWEQKIAFPLVSIMADQSRVWGVRSWSKQTSSQTLESASGGDNHGGVIACQLMLTIVSTLFESSER